MIIYSDLNQLNKVAPSLGGGILLPCVGLRKFPLRLPADPGKRKYPGEEEPWQKFCCFCSLYQAIFLPLTWCRYHPSCSYVVCLFPTKHFPHLLWWHCPRSPAVSCITKGCRVPWHVDLCWTACQGPWLLWGLFLLEKHASFIQGDCWAAWWSHLAWSWHKDSECAVANHISWASPIPGAHAEGTREALHPRWIQECAICAIAALPRQRNAPQTPLWIYLSSFPHAEMSSLNLLPSWDRQNFIRKLWDPILNQLWRPFSLVETERDLHLPANALAFPQKWADTTNGDLLSWDLELPWIILSLLELSLMQIICEVAYAKYIST